MNAGTLASPRSTLLPRPHDASAPHNPLRRLQSKHSETSQGRLQTWAAWVLVAYAALVPVVPGVPVGGVVVAGIDMLFPFAAVLICLVMGKRLPLWTISLLALVALSGASLLAIQHPRVQWECALRVVRLVETIAPLFLALGIRRQEAVFRKVFYTFVASGTLSILIGLVLFWLQIELRSDQQKTVFDSGEYLFRAGGIFGDSSAFGHLIASWFAVILLAGPLFFSRGWLRIIGPLALCLAAYGLYASSSRSCLMNFGGVALFCLFIKSPAAWRARAAAVFPTLTLLGACLMVAILLGAVGGIAYLFEHVSERFLSGFLTFLTDPNTASAGRTDLWARHYELFLESPLIGIGYKALYLGMDLPPDNNFIAVAVEVGLFGLAALLLFYGSLFTALAKQYKTGDALAWIIMGVWVGQVIHSITVDIWTFWGSMPIVLLITGLLAARPSPRHPPAKQRINPARFAMARSRPKGNV